VQLDVVWRRPLGSGYSSVSVAGERAVTMAAFDGGDHLVAVNTGSGEELWSVRVADTYLGRSGSDDGPASTPALDGSAAYGLTAAGNLIAVELSSGTVRWRRHLEQDFGTEPHTYGYSTAPVIHEDTLFILGGPAEGSAVLALETATGDLRWSAGSGSVEHHNPAVVRLAGVEQVVAPTARAVAGYSVTDGAELWRHEFDSGSHSGDVTPVDEEHLLLTRWDGNSLLRLESHDGLLRPTVVWTSRDLEGTYAVPVRHDGHLYGFDSRFLTCVSLATGERVWRSRPPNGSGLILIDGLLATVSASGELVLAEASPAGYTEHSRLPLFEPRRVMTPPSVAAGALFVRNLEELVALRPRVGAGPARSERGDGDPWIEALRQRVARAEDSAMAIESFLADVPSQPHLQDGRAYFFYQGELEDLVITGDMTGGFAELPMHRLPGTDLYYRSFDLPAGGERWEYAFKSFEETILDTRNPRTAATPDGPRSVALLGDAAKLTFPAACDACPKGRLETLRFGSEDAGGYGATLYLPAAYDAEPERSFPLAIWVLGADALEFGRVPEALDTWIAEGGQPVIAAFLELPGGLIWEPQRQAFNATMSDEVLSTLESAFRVSPRPRDRALIVQQWAAESGLPWVLGEPRIAKLGAQSPMLGKHYVERRLAPVANIEQKLSVYVDWGRYDATNVSEGLDVAAQAGAMAQVLEHSGHQVQATETPGGSNWTRWRRGTPQLLDALFAQPNQTSPE